MVKQPSTGEKPNLCPSCDFTTADPGSLTRHRKRSHSYIPHHREPAHHPAASHLGASRSSPVSRTDDTLLGEVAIDHSSDSDDEFVLMRSSSSASFNRINSPECPAGGSASGHRAKSTMRSARNIPHPTSSNYCREARLPPSLPTRLSIADLLN